MTRGREAVSPERAPPLASPLSSPLASFLPLWPSKHFASGTLNLSPGGEGLIEALPLPTQGPPLILLVMAMPLSTLVIELLPKSILQPLPAL